MTMDFFKGTAKVFSNIVYIGAGREKVEVTLILRTIKFRKSFKTHDGTKVVLVVQKAGQVVCESSEKVLIYPFVHITSKLYSINAVNVIVGCETHSQVIKSDNQLSCTCDLGSNEKLKFNSTLKRDYSGKMMVLKTMT